MKELPMTRTGIQNYESEIENKTEEERQLIEKRRSSLMTSARTLGQTRLMPVAVVVLEKKN